MNYITVYCEDCQAITTLMYVLKKYHPPEMIVTTQALDELIIKVKNHTPRLVLTHPPYQTNSSAAVIRKIRSSHNGASIPLYVVNQYLTESDYETFITGILAKTWRLFGEAGAAHHG